MSLPHRAFPLDIGYSVLDIEYSRMVASLGFEPKQTESESVVLPLHYEAITRKGHTV